MLRLTCLSLVLTTCLFSCQKKPSEVNIPKVQIASAMKHVMWKGELAGTIQLDSVAERGNTFGIGPLEYLQGEILLFEGEVYVSKVTDDTAMEVFQDPKAKAPFFVYSQVEDWQEITLPDSIHNITSLEAFLLEKSKPSPLPFAFKVKGAIKSAEIHIQNLPPDTKVSSPKEAHQGQVNYMLNASKVDLLGFFSTQHQGVFTHHDSFVHLHLITADRQQMGHLDAVDFSSSAMVLYVPKGQFHE